MWQFALDVEVALGSSPAWNSHQLSPLRILRHIFSAPSAGPQATSYRLIRFRCQIDECPIRLVHHRHHGPRQRESQTDVQGMRTG